MQANNGRSTWGSRLGFILASAGSAVGLGAIWKFPYMAGSNGGSAFILPYIVLTVLIGFVLLLIEMSIGREARAGAGQAFGRLVNKRWNCVGLLSVLTGFLILAFYQVIGGWCLNYMLDACMGRGLITDTSKLGEYFGQFVSNGTMSITMQLSFLALTAGVLVFGVQKGIERVSKILMPLLFVMMLVLIVRGLMLDGAWKGVEFMFKFDASAFTSGSLLNALGFSFFSLSLASGAMMNYGSYLSDDASMPRSVAWISVLAVMAALLGGLMIMPAVFAFGLDPSAGPGLTFVTMPAVFAQLPMGQLLAVIFYACLVVAALTSAISIMEMSVQYLIDRFGMSRGCSITWNTVALVILGIPCALSFGSMSDVLFFGKTFFDILDYMTSNIGMPIGGLAIAIVGGYLAWPAMRKQMHMNETVPAWLETFVKISIKFISPAVIVVIALAGLLG